MLCYEKGGSGNRAILLLHGLGATSAVWTGVQRVLQQRQLGRWFAPDLSGHGSSDPQPHYSVGRLADELSDLLHDERELFIIGHSLGVYVALALASGWFGVEVRGIVGLGPRISWPEADLRSVRELASRPTRFYSSSEEAWHRYRRVSGLDAATAPEEEWLQRGISLTGQGWRLAQDPRTFAVAGAPFDSLMRSARARVLLSRGEHDPMVGIEELRQYCDLTAEIAGGGHNAHVQKPECIVRLLERVLGDG